MSNKMPSTIDTEGRVLPFKFAEAAGIQVGSEPMEKTSSSTNSDSSSAARPWRDVFAFVALLAVVLALWIVQVWTDRPETLSYVARDLYAYYFPSLEYYFATLRSGQFPWWNPYELAGMPFFATHQWGPLYPGTVIYALGEISEMHLVSGLVHVAMLGGFTYAFLRIAIGTSVLASLFGALTIALSGWALSRSLIYPDAIRSGAYIPAVLLCANRVVARETVAWTVALGTALALQFLAGEIEIVVRTGWLLGAYATLLLLGSYRVDRDTKRLANRTGRLVFAGIVSIGLCMPQLWATANAASQGLRSTGGISYAQAVNPIDGGMEDPLRLLALMITDGGAPYIFYVGAIPLLFGAYALRRRNADAWFFGAGTAIVFLLILGDGSPLYRLYFTVPTGDWFRFPLRFQPFFLFCLSVVAALGLDAWLDDIKRKETRSQIPAALFCTAALILCAAASQLLLLLETTVACMVFGALWVWMALQWLGRIGKGQRWIGAGVLAGAIAPAFLLMDLSPYVTPKHPDLVGMPTEIRAALDGARAADGNELADRVFVDVAWAGGRRAPKYGLLTETPSISGFSAFVPASFWGFIKPYRAERLRDSAGETEAEGHDASLGLWGGLSAASGAAEALNLLGVRYLVVGPGSELFADNGLPERGDIPKNFSILHESEGVFVVENTTVWPRAFVLPGVEAIGTVSELRDAFDTEHIAASIIEYSPERVQVEVPAGASGLLVLTDQDYPGWSAGPHEIVPVAGVFRGVVVDGSQEQIEFAYRSPGAAFARTIATGTLVVLLLTIASGWRRRARKR